MISTIEISGPATFKTRATLTTDKKVNLIYGLNGSGKSTICRFLKSPSTQEFSNCKILPLPASTLHVYNNDFVRENFHESETLKGIFTLSKENKEADQRIAAATKKREQHSLHKQELLTKRTVQADALLTSKRLAEDATWEIKTKYSGGDRVLEYCLEGLKGKKDSLFNHILALPKPSVAPLHTTEQLKTEAQALSKQDAAAAIPLALVAINVRPVESDNVFQTPIIGNDHSTVAQLIQELGNSDWVRTGLTFAKDPSEKSTQCPFCQSETITQALLSQIRDYFDETYLEAVNRVRAHLDVYLNQISKLPSSDELKSHPFITERLLLLVQELRTTLAGNLSSIEKKAQSPSLIVSLSDSSPLISSINELIGTINEQVDAHNDKLSNKDRELREIKTSFWSLMRWNYDQSIKRYLDDQTSISSAIATIETDLTITENLISAANAEIAAAQKETVNTDQAVANINGTLLELGIDDFSVQKHDENFYCLRRTNTSTSSDFSTFSEGEKMIITLLYFCEVCKGRKSAEDVNDEKIVIFDDPISSLSHIYVFNVGQLLRSTFFQSDLIKQVFVFTHSLYFFYELTDPKHERREKEQALFRITKSNGQSSISSMKYEEIQNDYQAFWQVINDELQHPALIANCMRNIIDYFFNFVSKLDFNNVFQQPELKTNRFQSFSRFMNRESHTLGQNIYDLKEFDYEIFKDGLRLVFEKSGYSDHFKRMSRI